MIYNQFIISSKEIDNNLTNEEIMNDKKPNSDEKPDAVIVPEVEIEDNPNPEQDPENPENPENGKGDPSENNLPDKVKEVLTKVRQEKSEAEKKAKAAEEKLQSLENKLKDIEEKELKQNNDFKTLYENTVTKLADSTATRKVLEEKVQSLEEARTKEVESVSNILNDMIDLNISDWDDEYKSFIEDRESVSPEVRFNQYKKVQPLVEKAKPPILGANPSPKPVNQDPTNVQEREILEQRSTLKNNLRY